MKIPVVINDNKVVLEAEPDEKLIDILRKEKLFSVKHGCEKGFCGACTVLLDGKPVSSCIIPVGIVRDCKIVTLEHFKSDPLYTDIMTGFTKAGIHLCGYCNAGKIFTAYEVLTSFYKPDKDQLYSMLNKYDCCCTDIETLANGILYATAYKHAREGKHKNGKK